MLRKAMIIVIGAIALASSIALETRRGEGSDSSSAQPARVETGLRFQRVRLSTGVELQVAERGPVDGRPVLFLHGFTDSWFSYSRILDGLPANIRAIVPTQRGHGDSERPKCCYRVSDFAQDAVALLDALGIKQADLVGHSMGSFIAQRIAVDFPERVDRLVLIGSGATAQTPAVSEFSQAVQTLTDPVPAAFVRDFQVSTAHEPLPAAFLDRVIQESSKVPAVVWRSVLAGLLSANARVELGRIQAPTLIMWGEHDAFWDQKEQELLRRAIPRSRLITYQRVGHAPHWENPAAVLVDLAGFLNLTSVSPSAVAPREASAHTHVHSAGSGDVPLLDGLGNWHHEITTRSPDAQKYFDQGLRLSYAFNHDEAARSFERAVQLDSTCALCYWGIAYAVGPNINLPMSGTVEPRALAAIGQAARFAKGATALERALIDAMATRYGTPAGATRAARDSAYAAAMRAVARRFPRDADAQVLFADAMLNLRPWNQWTRDGRPQPGTEELVVALERALGLAPNHAGACHLYVHAVEASNTPERALPCAERLPRLMPGAGHVVHMPAHTYLRVGRYEDAARANIAAVEADQRYFTQHHVAPGVYPMFYAPHNLHFLWATYLLSGQKAKALGAARALAERVSVQDARANAPLEAMLIPEILTLTRFGDWPGVLQVPAPAPELRYARGMWHYARGMARSATGDLQRARAELDTVRATAAQVPSDLIIILNAAPVLLKLASEVLAGDIAAREKRWDEAIARFRAAAQIEDGLTYDEPPPWYHSARNFLGETLLEANRAAEAEAAFRADLRFMRETGWSLSGLERALRAQGKKDEAAAVARRLEEAWKYADVARPN